jgi:hypothetical protein
MFNADVLSGTVFHKVMMQVEILTKQFTRNL